MLPNLKLTDASIAAIEASTGIAYQEMIRSSATDIDRKIEMKYRTTLEYNYKEEDIRTMSRGSVFVASRRFLHLTE